MRKYHRAGGPRVPSQRGGLAHHTRTAPAEHRGQSCLCPRESDGDGCAWVSPSSPRCGRDTCSQGHAATKTLRGARRTSGHSGRGRPPLPHWAMVLGLRVRCPCRPHQHRGDGAAVPQGTREQPARLASHPRRGDVTAGGRPRGPRARPAGPPRMTARNGESISGSFHVA